MKKKIIIGSIILIITGTFSWARINDWRLRIGVKSDTARDSYNFLGVSKEASLYFDSKDILEPPPSPSGLCLYFPHQDWPDHQGRYATDFRPPVLDVECFDVVVEAESGPEFTLFWSLEKVPPMYAVTLMVSGKDVTIDMRETTEYVFDTGPEGKAEFQVLVEWKKIR